MPRILKLAPAAIAISILAVTLGGPAPLPAGQPSVYKVLEPIAQGNLTIFPVVTANVHDTSGFLTLDEGMRTGEVVITERGMDRAALIPPRRQRREFDPGFVLNPRDERADVNRLVLVNHSSRPLILLAGEIVAGGKQDRVVAKDRIVPAHSDPIDLSVFCVEPHRWVAAGEFASGDAPMAQPSVRSKVMIDRDQESVWASVGSVRGRVMAAAPSRVAAQLSANSSYAALMKNPAVQEELREVAAPIEQSYGRLELQLRTLKAVGAVVAVNGRIQWADVFASPELLNLYWPKLVRSYAAEAISAPGLPRVATARAAQAFLDNWNGCGESAEMEDGVYRLSKISGEYFNAFRLTSLVPHTGFDVHVTKIAEAQGIVCAK